MLFTCRGKKHTRMQQNRVRSNFVSEIVSSDNQQSEDRLLTPDPFEIIKSSLKVIGTQLL